MSEAGKGDKPRPREVDRDTFNNNWDKIFGTNKPKGNNHE